MPAPTPIVMRYGDDGLLGQAAATAGYGAGLLDLQHRQQAQHQAGYAADLNFISDQMARRQQADQFAQQQQQQASQLQQAGALLHQQPANPGGTVTYTGAADTIRGMKTLSINNILGDTEIDPAQRDQLMTLAAHDNVPIAEVEHLAKGVVAASSAAAEKKAKLEYVNTVLPSLPAEEQAGLTSLAKSDKVTPQQLRVAVDEVKSRVGMQTHQHTQAQLSGLDAQARTLKAQADQLAKALRASGFDPNAAPDQFNPTYADPNAATFNTEGFKGSLADAYTGKGKLVSGGDPAALATYKQYVIVQNQLQDLLGQREKLVNGGGRGTSPAGNPATGQQQQAAAANPAAQMSDADLLKALGS